MTLLLMHFITTHHASDMICISVFAYVLPKITILEAEHWVWKYSHVNHHTDM